MLVMASSLFLEMVIRVVVGGQAKNTIAVDWGTRKVLPSRWEGPAVTVGRVEV
jgi:hypothetical protein